ncbi:lipoyl amidotransferase LIPT1, mitochondrial isoform 1-T2 [Pholidichthys leucotaenia]
MMAQLRRTFPLLTVKPVQARFWSSSALFADSGSEMVLRSQSTDVFENLALEDWINTNVDLQQHGVLLLWRNRPTVVIGRHQNPWAECHLGAMKKAGISLARRRSGGGTVFHDLGNLNLTFFCSKKAYNRQRNLNVVTEALKRIRPELDVRATERLDILLNGHFKISGTASRLSRKSSYHHCTLLHSANRSTLSSVLRPSCPGIQSNATPSVPSPVANLVDHAPDLQLEELLEALAQQYSSEFGVHSPPVFVHPSDESLFPGLSLMAAELRSWDWTFGKTPKFTVETPLVLRDRSSACSTAALHMQVKDGLIQNCQLNVPSNWLPARLSGELSSVLTGERFCPQRAAVAMTMLLRTESTQLHGRLTNLCDVVVAAMG